MILSRLFLCLGRVLRQTDATFDLYESRDVVNVIHTAVFQHTRTHTMRTYSIALSVVSQLNSTSHSL